MTLAHIAFGSVCNIFQHAILNLHPKILLSVNVVGRGTGHTNHNILNIACDQVQ